MCDKIILLQCNPDAIIERLNNRTDNDFGKDDGVKDNILSEQQPLKERMQKHGAVIVDTNTSEMDVIQRVIEEVS